ncbi:Protein ltv1 [Malassezia sp. CBS 17886]|nr:Protein ltv1 [Malassezia sp. CBS 17886]
MAPRSKWREPDAVHFQVVHRSQRDALRDDPDAGPHVLKPYAPPNRKGKSRAQIAGEDPALASAEARANVGEAAQYGVYYDDTEYDYMQHLRAINDHENSKHGGVDEQADADAIWVQSAVQPQERAKDFALRSEDATPGAAPAAGPQPPILLPASAFPSAELPRDYSAAYDVDPQLQGLQPDMDPHLRQTLEALDDDEFVEDAVDDDLLSSLVRGGAWDGQRTVEDAWRDAAPEGDDIWLDPFQRAQRERDALLAQGGSAAVDEGLSLEARMALFKAQQAQQAQRAHREGSAEESGEEQGTELADEARDALDELPPRTAGRRPHAAGSVSSTGSALGRPGRPGALARRAASTRAPSAGGGSTMWSMSSSAMFRNRGLSDLDDKFDKVLVDYDAHTEDPELDALREKRPADDADTELDYDTVEARTRADFEQIMDEFLDRSEVIAGKLKPTLGARGTTADEKLDMVRKALGAARIDDGAADASAPAHENPFLNPALLRADRDQWDVETVQTTKTNLDNHPRTIAAAESVPGGARTPGGREHARERASPEDVMDADTHGSGAPEHGDTQDPPPPPPAQRSRTETTEERRARKDAVRQLKQARRADKAVTKQAFADERKRQTHASQRQHEVGATGAMRLA